MEQPTTRQTISSDYYILKAQNCRVRPEKKTTFLLNDGNTIPFWEDHEVHCQSLTGMSYHTRHRVWIWNLPIFICSGHWKMNCVGNIFLETMPSGAALFFFLFLISTACRLLLITGKNAYLIVDNVDKLFCSSEFAQSSIAMVLWYICCCFHGN